ncbi:MAG: hypothetical protein ACK2TV_00695 [Anaerolineales bacterium]
MNKNSKAKTMVLGAVIGALAGLASAYLLIKRAEDTEEKPALTPGEGLQLGLGVLGLMRLIAGHSKD